MNKKEERAILRIFMELNNIQCENDDIIEGEAPDFIVNGQEIEVTRMTHKKEHEDMDAYIKFIKYIEESLRNKYRIPLHVQLIPKDNKIPQFKKIRKKTLNNIIEIIECEKEKEIDIDFIRNMKYRKSFLRQYFGKLIINEEPGIYGLGFDDSYDFTELINTTIRNKYEKKYLERYNKRFDLVIYGLGDIVRTKKDIDFNRIIDYRVNFKNVYILLLNREKRFDLIKL